MKKEETLSLEVVENALLRYSKKLETQHQESLSKLDLNSANFL